MGVLRGSFCTGNVHRTDQHCNWRVDAKNSPSKTDGTCKRNAGPFYDVCTVFDTRLSGAVIPKFVSNIDYLYYGMGVIILIVFIFYFIALPKYSAQAVEVNVQETFQEQPKKKARSV